MDQVFCRIEFVGQGGGLRQQVVGVRTFGVQFQDFWPTSRAQASRLLAELHDHPIRTRTVIDSGSVASSA